MTRLGVLGVMLSLLVGVGCAPNRENIVYCKPMATIVGGIIGGTAAGVSTAVATGDNAAGAGAGAGGAIIGGLVGYALADHFCQLPPPPPYSPPPPPPPLPPGPRRIETLTGASFDFDKATLTMEGREHVDHAVQVMHNEPTLHVSVEGHTDSVGTPAYNLKLSLRRAKTVRDYMVSRGIDARRIVTEGYGDTHPIATNDTAEGRARNRRVEIIAQ